MIVTTPGERTVALDVVDQPLDEKTLVERELERLLEQLKVTGPAGEVAFRVMVTGAVEEKMVEDG